MTCSWYSAEVDISREREDDFAGGSKMPHFVFLKGSDNSRNAIEKVGREDRYHNIEEHSQHRWQRAVVTRAVLMS